MHRTIARDGRALAMQHARTAGARTRAAAADALALPLVDPSGDERASPAQPRPIPSLQTLFLPVALRCRLAMTDAPACYTTGRYRAGRLWLAERVAARLVRDARALGLGAHAADDVLERLLAAGRASFGDGEGVVRLEARAGGELVASTRPLGAEPETWRAIAARVVHPGPGTAPGAKRTGVGALASARTEAQAAGVDEALLFDAAGRLVEGARTNLALALADGRWVSPPAERGSVRGVALEAALAAGVSLEERDVSRGECLAALEIVATNAVRGARAIVALDAAPVGDGRPGPLRAALAAALARG